MIRTPRLSEKATIEEYFTWLCELVDMDLPNKSYRFLAQDLYLREFKWTVPNDDNRAFEGRNLREQFCDELGIEYVYEYFNSECSMLELIIALAYRCESIMVDQKCNIPMKDWFWKLLRNARLDECSNEYFFNIGVTDYVEQRLDAIINRTYRRNGEGGLFPLKRPKKDQRKVELWYQMSAYLVENYYTEDMIM